MWIVKWCIRSLVVNVRVLFSYNKMCQEEALAESDSEGEDPSSSDDSDSADDHDPEPVADEHLNDHDPEPVVDESPPAEVHVDGVLADDHDPEPAAEESPPAEVHVDKVVHLLRRAMARGKGLKAMEWFNMRVGQALPCLDGQILTAEALNGATDIVVTVAD
jgi:hypothetical protein